MGELLQMPGVAAAAEAPHLLCLADELGLSQLRRAAVAYIAQHYTKVQVGMSGETVTSNLRQYTVLVCSVASALQIAILFPC